MWTLVNASYGIAMGQRPEAIAEPGPRPASGIKDPTREGLHSAHVLAGKRSSLESIKIAIRYVLSRISSVSTIASSLSSR